MVGKGNGVKDRDMAGPCVYLGLSYPGTAASFRMYWGKDMLGKRMKLSPL